MNSLLVTEQVLDIKAGKVVSDFAISSTIRRFQTFGNLMIACCKYVGKTAQPLSIELDIPSENVVFLNKETDLRNRYIDRTHNRTQLERLVAKADFVIGYMPSTIGDMALAIAKKQGKHFMSFLVGCPWDALSNHRSWKARLMAPIRYWETRRSISTSDYVWYVTHQFLQHRYPTKGLAFGGTDTNIPVADDSTLTRRLQKIGSHKGETKLLTVGHVDVGFKGQQYVIGALPELVAKGIDAHYYMIGDGEGTWLKQLAEKLGVADRIHLLGRKYRDEVITFMDDCDIYVQVSLQEGLPRSVAEAMSRAMPCVVSNVGGMPEMIEEQLIVKPKSPRDIARAILLLDKKNMKQQAQKNFEQARQYQPDYIDKQLIPFFDIIKKNILQKSR